MEIFQFFIAGMIGSLSFWLLSLKDKKQHNEALRNAMSSHCALMRQNENLEVENNKLYDKIRKLEDELYRYRATRKDRVP